MTKEEAKKYFVIHTDNKETLQNALNKIAELAKLREQDIKE